MADAFCVILLVAFFWTLIWSIMKQPPRKAPAPEKKETPPSPVGLFCSVCQQPAGTVSHEEYMRISHPIYCQWCVIPIEAYKRQQAAR